jgi:multicomponent Na+:H+ antiporter subunit D
VRAVLVGFGVVTALVGAVMCLAQDHLKRLLAFVTISQIGLALIGIGLLTPGAGAGVALLIGADGLLRAGLFVCLGAVLHRCGSVYQSRLHGGGGAMQRAWPVLFVAGTLGLAALPPLGAFSGKALIEAAAVDLGYGWVTVVLIVATALTAAALLRAGARVFFGWGPESAVAIDPREPAGEDSEVLHSRRRVPAVMLASAAALIVGGLALGAVPGLVDEAQRGAHAFHDRATYAAAVLGRPLPPGGPVEAAHIGALEVATALLTVLGALVLAAALLGRPLFVPPAGLRLVAERAFLRLRRLHSGQIGDYVAWATLGFAVLGGCLALAT